MLNMNTTASRVKKMLSELDVDQVEFGRLAGASKSVVNQWLSGGIKSINPKYAYCIEKNCGYSAQWVITGEGDEKFLSPSSETQKTMAIKPPSRHEARIAEIVALLRQTDMEGLAVILDRARDAARDYPAAKETLVSSA